MDTLKIYHKCGMTYQSWKVATTYMVQRQQTQLLSKERFVFMGNKFGYDILGIDFTNMGSFFRYYLMLVFETIFVRFRRV